MTSYSHPILRPRSSVSYQLVFSAPDDLADWLQACRFQHIPLKAATEACRLRHASGQLVVIFHSGSVLLQGQHVDATRRLLFDLVEESEASI